MRARAPPSAASVICYRCLAQLAILFLRGHFFVRPRAFSRTICAQMIGENSLSHGFRLVSHGFALKNAIPLARISIYGLEA